MPRAAAGRPPTLPNRQTQCRPTGRCDFRQMEPIKTSHDDWAATLDSLVHGSAADIADDAIFVQTQRGAEVASSSRAELPDRLRMLLFLVNGRRRMSEYRDLLPRYRNIDDTFDMLARKGYIARLDSHARR